MPGENPLPPIGDEPAPVTSDAPADRRRAGREPRRRSAVPPARRARRRQDALQAADPGPQLRDKFPVGSDLSGELLALLATPTIADKTWVSRQYDHQLFLNTVAGPGADAAVLRVKGTPKALALSTDGKARFCRLDPRTGGRLAVLEAARNVACAGARPLALVNCLNFGNPEHPEVMWQFSEVVEGMSEACEALGVPRDRRQRQLLQRVGRRRHPSDAGRGCDRPDRRAARPPARGELARWRRHRRARRHPARARRFGMGRGRARPRRRHAAGRRPHTRGRGARTRRDGGARAR